MVAIRIPFIQPRNTNDYLRVLQEADTSGRFPFQQGPDGALSRQELDSYANNLGQQRQFMQLFGNFFQQFLGYNPFQQQLEDLNKKIEIAGNMQRNFGSFDRGQTGDQLDNQISYGDIFGVAGRDGNYNTISENDILDRQFPRPFPQPIPSPYDPPRIIPLNRQGQNPQQTA